MSARDFAELTHSAHGKPLQWWHYGDSFAVAAFIDRNGRRIALPAVRNGTSCYWHEPPGAMPLYGTAALRARPEAPVLVVETERAADAAGGLFPDHVCVTWAGGSNAVLRADIAPLSGRDVVLWPDRDGAGLTAMVRLQSRLRGRARSVARIDLPASWPASWDLAKPLPLGVTAETLRRMLRDAAVAPTPVETGTPEEPMPSRPVRTEEAVPMTAPTGDDAPVPGDAGACIARGESCPGSAGILPAHGLQFEPREGRLDSSTSLRAGTGAESEHRPDTDDDGPDSDPSPDDTSRGDLPAFPLDVLPSFWRSWAGHAACQAGAPVDYGALSLLTVAASLIGGARRISPVPAWREPCVLWTALVGAPGSGRGRGMDTALELLRALDTTSGDTHRQHAAWQEWSRQRARAWRQRVRNTASYSGATPPPLPADALEPAPPRQLVTEDTAVASVARLLRGNPRGILLAPGALADWLAHAARQRSGEDRRHWLRSWSARPWAVTCYRQFSVDIPCAAVSILGRLNPGALAPPRAGDDDDMVARCLFAAPPRPAFQPLSAATPEQGTDAPGALSRLRDMPEAVRDVPLASAALAAFEQFRRAHHAAASSLEGREAAWWSRGPAMVLRLAGVLAFLAWAARPEGVAEPAHISAGSIGAAIGLWRDYLWPHARAVFATAGSGDRQLQIDKVLRWLAAGGVREVSREQIRREALSQKVDAAGADAIIAALVERGWLQSLDPGTKGSGRPRHRWRVSTAPGAAAIPAIPATPNLPPAGEGGAQRRTGDVAAESMFDGWTESDRTSPFRPFGAPSPSGERACLATAEPISALPAITTFPPEGEGGAQRRKGDVATESMLE